MRDRWTKKYSRRSGMRRMFIFLMILAVLLLLLIYPLAYISSVDNPTITVVKSERITDGNDSYYLVYTDNETFKNVDSWIFLKFDSSDLYRELEIGKTYNVKVAGWRIPLFSSYRNIIKINQLEVNE